MRVGLLDQNPSWGGGEEWFLGAARALAARGHEVRVVAHPGSGLVERCAEAGVAAGPIGELDALLAAGPEVVLCNQARDVRLLARATGRRPPFRLVLRRGSDRRLVDNCLRRRTWRLLSAIVVNSDATGATVRRSLPWFPPERIRRIYNAVRFEAAPRDAAAEGPLRLAFAGRLARPKGVDVLLEAVSRLGDALDWRLELAGDGELRGALEAQAERLGIAARCRFLGHLPDPAPLYARAHVVVVPSRYEGFGYVAAEAALTGVPVIASRAGGLREVVRDEETGLLVRPEDPAALAEALRRLAADRALAERLGEAARASARERFDPGILDAELERVLLEVRSLPPVG